MNKAMGEALKRKRMQGVTIDIMVKPDDEMAQGMEPAMMSQMPNSMEEQDEKQNPDLAPEVMDEGDPMAMQAMQQEGMEAPMQSPEMIDYEFMGKSFKKPKRKV